ncbi:hypothetical protein ACLESD_08670 [Pyxidicoccus sp. 3LFB2]
MDDMQRVALAQRLERVEGELQRAAHGLDGSPEARTRYARARAKYQHAEQLSLAVLGARGALALVEAQPAFAYERIEGAPRLTTSGRLA